MTRLLHGSIVSTLRQSPRAAQHVSLYGQDYLEVESEQIQREIDACLQISRLMKAAREIAEKNISEGDTKDLLIDIETVQETAEKLAAGGNEVLDWR